MMGAVFVSYRREDSEGQARALSIELAQLIGKDSVFMDVDSIALGRDFRQVLQERLASCDILLALIGPEWLDSKDATGSRRLDRPTDFVRQEIAAALKRNIPVTPVLLRGAKMPAQERLPDDLKDLAYRNGFELSHTRWESDVREMVKRLGIGKAAVRQESPQSTVTLPVVEGGHSRPFGKWAMIAAGGVAVAVVIMLLWPDDQPVTTQAEQSTAAAEQLAAPVNVFKVGNLDWTTSARKSVDWNAASAYCKSLAVGARSGWRLPTRQELRTIYDPKDVDAFGNRVMRPFQAGLGGNWVWSSDKDTTSSAFVLDFKTGEEVSLAVSFGEGAGALCVRP
jgi:hypothetical protein